MFFTPILVLGIIFSAVVAIIAYRYPGYLKWVLIVGAIFMLLFMIFWQFGIVALSIAAVVYLAQEVIFGRIGGKEGISRAIFAYLLLLGGTWLAVDISRLLFFGGQSQLLELIRIMFSGTHSAIPNPSDIKVTHLFPNQISPAHFWAVIGVALLLLSVIFEKGPLAAASLIIGSVLSILVGVPIFIEWADSQTNYTPNHQLRPALILGCIILFIGMFVKLYIKNKKK